MPDREINRCHAVKIGAVELALSSRPVAHGLAKDFRQNIDHRVQDRDMGYPAFGAAALELGAQILVNDTHQQDAGIALDAGKNRVDMMQASHKCPHMFGRPDVGKLGHAGAGDLVNSLAGRVGYQMEVEQAVRHERKNRTPGDGCHDISLLAACVKAVPDPALSGDGSCA